MIFLEHEFACRGPLPNYWADAFNRQMHSDRPAAGSAHQQAKAPESISQADQSNHDQPHKDFIGRRKRLARLIPFAEPLVGRTSSARSPDSRRPAMLIPISTKATGGER